MTHTTKHTPGPWHIGMKPGPMVYGPQGEQVVPLNLMLDMPEVTANAHLIAAAPAMYEALQWAKQYLRMPDFHPDNSYNSEEWARDYNKLNDALAQAEGGGHE